MAQTGVQTTARLLKRLRAAIFSIKKRPKNDCGRGAGTMALICTDNGRRIGDGMRRHLPVPNHEAGRDALNGRGEIGLRRIESTARKSVAPPKAGQR